jgi:hypothetical protein
LRTTATRLGREVRIGKASRAYRAAERGDAPDPPDALVRRVQGIDGWKRAVEQAVTLVLEARHRSANERGFHAPKAWEILSDVATTEEEHHALLRITIYYAKQDMRWWVDNPDANGYCVVCRRQKILEEFPIFNRWKCRRCHAET